MKLIKLDAIDSTNDFLKSMSSQNTIDNYTIVSAEQQTGGKGQRGSKWFSEAGKNLLMSVLVKDFIANYDKVFNLNIVVSLAVIDALKSLHIPDLSVKWPNDIMSYNKKVGGILIENVLKSDGSIVSVVGLGLNVNQTDFGHLPHASSLAIIADKEFDKDAIIELIVDNIKNRIECWTEKSAVAWNDYLNSLFRKDVPMPFKNLKNNNFMGIIVGVSPSGKLKVLLEDDTVEEFDLKEIQMLY
jgi:BirA family biotin operon repressor/biotin-[acetyl-CoA-carboxylase] ligase